MVEVRSCKASDAVRFRTGAPSYFVRGSFNGRISAFQADSASSILAPRSKFNLCLAQSGRVLGLEPRGRRFESYSADQLRNG